MRPTGSAMLQQNNNNNYPCLSMSASTQQMLHQCPKASLPVPGRLELSLGDLPLIRGLRAWALCSKNRRRTGNLLEPATTRPLASCPRPSDVRLSGEGWGLGVDARQARIGALVTVATLKTSEGGGKTQTQCLFLRSEKGSCLYSTTKPGAAVLPVEGGGWLRGKTRDNGAHTEANWVRVRPGRRWRKSGNVSVVNRARQERQEEPDKGCLDRQEFPGPQEECRRNNQEDNQSLGRGIPNGPGKDPKALMKPEASKSHGHQRSSGTKREAQSRKETETSPNKDGHSPKHRDSNPDISRFLSENEDWPPSDSISTETINSEDKPCEAATQGLGYNSADGNRENEFTSSSMSSECSEFGQKGSERHQEADPLKNHQCPKEEEQPVGARESDETNTTQHNTQDKSQRFFPENEGRDEEPEVSDGGQSVPVSDQEQENKDRLQPERGGGADEIRRTLKKYGGEGRTPEHQDEETHGQTIKKQDVEKQEAKPEAPPSSHSPPLANLAPFPTPPLGSVPVGKVGGGKSLGRDLEETTATVASEDKEEDKEEEEFGVFMQADGETDWNQGLKTPVHCVGHGNSTVSEAPPHWTAGWMESSIHQWDDSWTAFSQDGDSGQWWPTSDTSSANQDLAAIFGDAFPSLPVSPQNDSSRIDGIPTLRELLQGAAHNHHQRLLDSFHDLDRIIGRRFHRSSSVSRNLLLRTLEMGPLQSETQHIASRRLSPGLPSANHNAPSSALGSAPKRRLSYDSNRNPSE